MLILKAPESFWADIVPGVRFKFRPIDPRSWRAGRRAAMAAIGEEASDDEIAGDALSRAMIIAGVEDWEGIGDAEGVAVAATPENIATFLDMDPRHFEACDEAYIMPFVLRDLEKNGSAVSPGGTGEAATPGSGTAASPAGRKTAAGVKSARTARKRPKALKAR